MRKGNISEKQLSNMNSNAPQGDHEVERTRDEEVDSKSNSENSNVNSIEDRQPKRRHYHRHTPQQIQEMEAFFKECPHPDDTQRRELSRQLGMEPLQVKFWFQNKRTQMKTQHEHQENTQLRTENDKLRAENMRFREALSNASCLNCGGPTPVRETSIHEHQLRMENSRLRQEIDHISSMTTKYVDKPITNSTETPSSSTPNLAAGNFKGSYTDSWSSMNIARQNEGYRPVVIELAVSAMEELMRIAQLGEPLWVPSMDRYTCALNQEEYLRAFSRVLGPKTDGFKSEASRETAVVAMTAANVVEILMDVEQWANVFSGVVSRATNLQVISSGLGGTYNEAVQVMNAEFQVPSPLVPTRESYFLRHCRRDLDGTWAVVDVSLDHLHSTPLITCRRRPSGCLIQDTPNGHSKVIWVEHVEVEDGGVHSIYKPLITAGLAFGARRWVAILDGYCQRVARALATSTVPPNDANYLGNQEGRKSMLKLAERMVTRFCRGVNASTANTWTTVSGNGSDNMKVMTRRNVDDPSMPFGVQLSIATSIWLPIPPKRVFDFLCDHNNRKEWDMLLNGGDVEEMAHVVSGTEEGNRVTIYQVKGANSSPSQMILLQESRTDSTASYVVYAPIDMVCANEVLGGGEASYVPLLPSGFAILPDGPITGGGQRKGMAAQADTGGSLLTVALQVLVDSTPNANLSLGSVAVANKLISCTVDKIKQALIPKSS